MSLPSPRQGLQRVSKSLGNLLHGHRTSCEDSDPYVASLGDEFRRALKKNSKHLEQLEEGEALAALTTLLGNAPLDRDDWAALYPQFCKNNGALDLSGFVALHETLGANGQLCELLPHLGVTDRCSVEAFCDAASKYQDQQVTPASLERFLSGRRFVDQRSCVRYVSHPDNGWVLHGGIVQPLDLPLTDYFIESSHNTYLSGNQLTSRSMVDRYKEVLLSGCRCVEIDCWDGTTGEPVCTHGRTLTSRIRFSDIIACVKQYAFVASPYPVILSLENHCSPKQQERMAGHLETILGSQLRLWDADRRCADSPEALKFCVLVKAKALGAERDEEEPEGGPARPDKPAKPKEGTAPALARLTYMSAVKCPDLEARLPEARPNEVTSFGEERADKLLRDHRALLARLNNRCFTRIYPAATRFDSKNPGLLEYLDAGCHMVALNYQSEDLYCWQNRAVFQSNGNCGLVLKPAYLREEREPPEARRTLLLTILASRNLSSYAAGSRSFAGIGSAMRQAKLASRHFVIEATLGTPDSENVACTDVTKLEGVDQVWRAAFTLPTPRPDLSVLTLTVYEVEPPDLNWRVVATTSALVASIRKGYRRASLTTAAGEPLPHAYLLLDIAVVDDLLPFNGPHLTDRRTRLVEATVNRALSGIPRADTFDVFSDESWEAPPQGLRRVMTGVSTRMSPREKGTPRGTGGPASGPGAGAPLSPPSGSPCTGRRVSFDAQSQDSAEGRLPRALSRPKSWFSKK